MLSRFQTPHANVVMCILLNEPKISIFVRTLPQVAESVFLSLSPEMCLQSEHVLVGLILHINKRVQYPIFCNDLNSDLYNIL